MIPLDRKFAATELGDVDETGTFTGYASVFGAVDLGQEVVAAGAFTKSLAERGAGGIRMLFQHNPDEPIGHWLSVEEDAHGLKVCGRISTEVARGREVLALMQAGGLDGLSIGYRTVRAERDRQGRRVLTEVELWEVSLVTFPMLPEARVDSVKSRVRRQTNNDHASERLVATIRRAIRLLNERKSLR